MNLPPDSPVMITNYSRCLKWIPSTVKDQIGVSSYRCSSPKVLLKRHQNKIIPRTYTSSIQIYDRQNGSAVQDSPPEDFVLYSGTQSAEATEISISDSPATPQGDQPGCVIQLLNWIFKFAIFQ